MPDGVPEELPPEAAGLYNTIGSLITGGVGADRAYRTLRDAGAGLTRSVVRQIAGEIRTSLGYRQDIARLNRRNPIPERYVSTESHLRADTYVHRVSMLLRDQVTGYTVQQLFSYVSPALATPDDVLEAAFDSVDEGTSFEGFEVVAAGIVSVGHR